MNDFLPVILGSDPNVYGVASSFDEAYGIKSVAISKTHQFYTEHLDFLKVESFDNIDKSGDDFVEILNSFAKRPENRGKELLLFPCSDGYVGLAIENRDRLDPAYKLNVISKELRNRLENKKDFYETCKEYGLPFPETFIITSENYKDFSLPFDYPVIAKPNDSIKYVEIDHFEGYKKAYKAENREELLSILEKVYAAGYDDDFIIQDFIPGGTDAMYVVNAYVGQNGKVQMTCGARCALDECLPNDIGNYNALITGSYPALTESVKEFLEKIEYRGFANFDFKYDRRDDTYKVFEINLRNGRSSYYMTVAGNNFVKYPVMDLIEDNPSAYVDFRKEHLWYHTAKSVLLAYTPESMKEQVKRLFKERKATFSLSYKAWRNPYREAYCLRRKLSTIKYYPKLEGKRRED